MSVKLNAHHLPPSPILVSSRLTGPDDEDATIVPDGVTLEPGEYMVLCEDVHFPFGIGT